jgi:acetyl esterase/lipase
VGDAVAAKQVQTPQKRRFYRRPWFWAPAAAFLVAIVGLLLAFNLSPRPGAALIKYVFERNSGEHRAEMAAYAPEGIVTISDQQYRPGDDDAYLDVYYPSASDQPGVQLPTLVWTHGGAWVSGDKADNSPYFEIIANEGYTVVSLDYTLGPDKQYPTAIEQINDALAFLQQNALQYHIDPNKIMMAGDSAGAQLTSQMAAIITNPEFAAEVGVTPSIQASQLRGVVLFCGIYDMPTFMKKGGVPGGLTGGILQWGSRTSVWAYAGTKDSDSPALQQMSTLFHVTAAYPPTFISGGNDDPLTDHQSIPLANKLHELGVPTTTLFFPPDHERGLEHEYQFSLDLADAQTALQQMLAFLRERSS